jgi:EAL domain-containing protein (putative c-di-GMP-specific phosphodiesterase class I)
VLCNGWLELWYQSKIDPQSQVSRGAEALIRASSDLGRRRAGIFHPDDPYLHALSRFVIARALADLTQFARAKHPVRASIPLPLLALEDMAVH